MSARNSIDRGKLSTKKTHTDLPQALTDTDRVSSTRLITVELKRKYLATEMIYGDDPIVRRSSSAKENKSLIYYYFLNMV